MRTYTSQQRAIALASGIVCHLTFAIGIAAMILGIYTGLGIGRGRLGGVAGFGWDLLLLLLFVAMHSFLLGARGRRLLDRLVPLGLGRDLATTTYATLASAQLLVTFAAWSPLGPVWYRPHGPQLAVTTIAYAASWGLVLKAMADSGLAVQTGFLGWGAVVRGRAPRFAGFHVRGLFRHVRQPIYIAFALTLWTGPVWTPDHLMLAVTWTLYCVAGPRLKERRYLAIYGDRFRTYRERVPYWVPELRRSPVARRHGSAI